LEIFFEIRVGNVLKFLRGKKSGQNDDFNPFKSAPKAERANITARANNTALMVISCRKVSKIFVQTFKLNSI